MQIEGGIIEVSVLLNVFFFAKQMNSARLTTHTVDYTLNRTVPIHQFKKKIVFKLIKFKSGLRC